MDIRCRKTKCKFNNDYTCKARCINISNEITCSTFDNQNVKKEDTSKNIFKEAPKYAPMRDSKKLCINCEAKCMFNHEKRCEANGITVNVIDECPYCVTFLKK